MGRARGAENNTNLADEQPDPVKARIINRDYGPDAAAQRWFWLTPLAVSKLAQMGGEILRGRTGEKHNRKMRRTITPEQEDAIIAAATAAGKVHGIGAPWGVSDSLVRTLFRERGIEYPRTPYAVRLGLDLQARKRAARIAKAAAAMTVAVDAAAGITLPEVTVSDVIADMSEGLGLAAIARKRGVPVHRITRICRIRRIPGAHSHA